METDENYVSNYYNKKFSIVNAIIDRKLADDWVKEVTPKMEGEGFTFGNANSSQSIDVKRNSLYNVAFNNKEGGFVDNFNHRYNAFITDCVSFNNKINYKFANYTLSKWSNNWSWSSRNKVQLNGDVKLNTPRNTAAAQRQFISIRNQITNAVFANMFPDGINFDRAIRSLSQ